MKSIEKIDYLFSLLPGPKSESWKYTNIKKFLTKDLLLECGEAKADLDVQKINQNTVSLNNSHVIWFENGVFNESLSEVPKGVKIQKIDGSQSDSHGFYLDPKKQTFSKKIQESCLFNKTERLDNLLKINNLYNTPTYIIEFDSGFNCNNYLEIKNVLQKKSPTLNQQRLLFLINPNARVKIIEQNIDLSECSNFNNSVSELICLDNSFLEHVIVGDVWQNSCSVKNVFVTQNKKSQSFFYNFSLNGKMSRNNYHVNLNESLSSTNLYGFSCLKNKSHIDNFINVIHSASDCKSSQLFKSIYDNNSSGVFFGGIFVDKNSQKTEAFQQNNNILLSEKAYVNAIPKLEIFADDVACSHGCTIGQPDFDAIFYLQSRGLKKEDAQSILNFAFLNDTFNSVSSKDLEQIIRNLVLTQLNLKHYS